MAVNNPVDTKIRNLASAPSDAVSGDFENLNGERYYAIRNVDAMAPFFVSVISSDDHWLFASSTGGLTAGRRSPETALFPYITVDRIHDSTTHTGSVTMLHLHDDGKVTTWEPFNREQNGLYRTTRNLYKSLLGHKLCFEEVNHDLDLIFRYTWLTSDRFGFVRRSELINLSARARGIDMLDGLQNILPAGTPRFTQTNSSNLVDAYKWTEYDPASGLALLTLYSGITDRAEPCESLKATVAYCLGLSDATVAICSQQLRGFRAGQGITGERLKRGVRGAFLVSSQLELGAGESREWRIIVNAEQTQSEVVTLRKQLAQPVALGEQIVESINGGTDQLARIMASADAYQSTDEEIVANHHYANVLFNVLRGGIFADQYHVGAADLRQTIQHFNARVYNRHAVALNGLPERMTGGQVLKFAKDSKDPQLLRLCQEYLPITFGRRHGDPSRPWNQFAIRLRDDDGNPRLSYEGNWRDIFQNWEALTFSFPEFVESIIAKFVNASTIDGYNPYRITKEGIDWEVEDPEDPWSYIGYWGDHQIIYLLKLLELSRRFHPQRLSQLLHSDSFSYANVPYRIRSFDDLLNDPKATVDYDDALAARIDERLESIGADGKLLLDGDGNVYQVTLLEKLLVPLLSKLGNLVVDGGIWMNTQRPEWNDANNALVGQGLSMVTLYYLRRYVHFLQRLLDAETSAGQMSTEVAQWMTATAATLADLSADLDGSPVSPETRFAVLESLGRAADTYRSTVYSAEGFAGKVDVDIDGVKALLGDALIAIDHCIGTNRRSDGLYHAYNLLEIEDGALDIARLYPMLEGQVSALSAGSLDPATAVTVLEALFESSVYRPDQNSFMLYPDRDLPSFLEKNAIDPERVDAIPLLKAMVAQGDDSIVERDADGVYRFNPDFVNRGNLAAALDALSDDDHAELTDADRQALMDLYEDVFNHQAFTGRSGTMFGFEGLGCIYWHMVSKLLLAVQENYFSAIRSPQHSAEAQALGDLYYRVRKGIGFNKTPSEFGAFPADPYSHSPKHSGARQPGMTGQVKEEILTRFGELGIHVSRGTVRFAPTLLREQEFDPNARTFCFVDVDDTWQSIDVPANSIAFTWCQVPVVYELTDSDAAELTITLNDDGEEQPRDGVLPDALAAELFMRSGRVRRLQVRVPRSSLFSESPAN